MTPSSTLTDQFELARASVVAPFGDAYACASMSRRPPGRRASPNETSYTMAMLLNMRPVDPMG